MNANQIVNMILRMVMRNVVNRGMSAGINAASKRMSKPKRPGRGEPRPPERARRDDPPRDR